MKHETKQYWTLSAIYRMLRLKKINLEQAERLLHTKAYYKPHMARQIKEMWLTSHPIKKAWGQS